MIDNIIHFRDFKPKKTRFIRKNKYIDVAEDYICLDTETSYSGNVDYRETLKGWVYQWCFSYQNKYVIGRYVDDFILCLNKIKKLYTNDKQTTIIYVHNLSYDLQYIKNFLFKEYGTEYKMIVVGNHKYISFNIGGFEFRCSWKLSNRSLDKWSRDLNTKHKKLVGTIDYNVIRYPHSTLSKKDWKYMIYDVVVLKECLEKEMLLEHDTIATIPLTSTGYVRRDARKLFKENYSQNRKKFLSSRLTKEQYLFCKKAFSGGLTHANRFIIDETIEGNIRHFDFTSHYPSQQRCKYFPCDKFNLIGENLYFEDLDKYSNYCLLIKIAIENIELKNKNITLPYLQESKVRQGKQGNIHTICDNGRILKMTGLTILYLTELDLDIIKRQYKIDKYVIIKAYGAIKGKIPDYLSKLIDNYFLKKSELKELLKIEQNEDNEINLTKSKNKLNGIYGMSATDIIRKDYEYEIETGEWMEKSVEFEDIEEKLDKYYSSKNNFMMYQLGLWTTAHARYELVDFVENCVGYENFLYCDTDSIFFLANEENLKKIAEKNKMFRVDATKNKQYVETENNKYFYHHFDDEKENIIKFRTLHSKCYAYVTDDNKLHCTVAGVQRKSGNITREMELQSIDNLTEGFIFKKCGGTRVIYIEKNEQTESCAIITKTTKTLNNYIDKDYDIYEEWL